MDANPITDYGTLSDLQFSSDKAAGIFWLTGYNREGDRISVALTEGILLSIWANLTQLLYPHAADMLTQQAETARAKRSTIAESAYLAGVTYHTSNGLIELRGVSAGQFWLLRFAASEGYGLWAKLEEYIDNV